MMLKRLSVILMALMGWWVFFHLAGCVSADKEYAEDSMAMESPYATPDGLYNGQATRAYAKQEEVEAASSTSYGESRTRSSRRDAPSASPGDSSTQSSGGGAEPQPDLERKLIRNGRFTLELDDVEDFEPTLERLRVTAESMEGYVQSEGSSTMTVMVPTERTDEAIAAIEALGEVIYRDVTVVDATAQYVDLQVRIDNLRKMRVRLTELVNQSTSVSEVLEVERELARVTGELERIQGQMRVLSKQTSYATLRVSLEERVKPGPLGWIFYGVARGVKWLFVRN